MSNSQPIVKVENLWHIYLRDTPLEVVALRGVDMEVYKGEAVGIIGHTGAGKSTLVQHLNGLLRPHKGKVIIDGVDLSQEGVDIRAIRQKVGLVSQYPERQLFKDYVADDIAFGPQQFGLPPEEVRERVKWAMEMVGLDFERFKDRYTFSLSGGEMRRAAIAGVLALRPKILILDESTSGLDPRGRSDLLRRIKELHEKEGLTIIFVSPNMEDMAELVDRIYILADGQVVMSGTPREIFSQPEELYRLGLGIPQVTEVMHALRARGKNVRVDVLTVVEAEAEVCKLLNC
ncbi:MAG TPA: energy-coupling factor transporter ATPase [Chloroflexi bacterium]|nr:energy-coupling factor transporter ATPase [Chloroflexota bacterium]